ncbi:MAG: hypothetical protein IIB77_04515 [Proteobacteria bacterium]|nr:hypothetical protein [Pseudomonadota bacterium]
MIKIPKSNGELRDATTSGDGMQLTPGDFDYDVLTMQRDPVLEGRFVWRIVRHQATLD